LKDLARGKSEQKRLLLPRFAGFAAVFIIVFIRLNVESSLNSSKVLPGLSNILSKGERQQWRSISASEIKPEVLLMADLHLSSVKNEVNNEDKSSAIEINSPFHFMLLVKRKFSSQDSIVA